MDIDKRRFIKDPVWGNIEIFEWEKVILDNFLLNRLHNVIQNSCAYKVYPGLRHSRFSHSIGVMHAATQMYINAVVNSPSLAKDKLQPELDLLRGQLQRGDGIARREIQKTVSRVTGCPKRWALQLASIRIAALLHDIGHLPFSHVFEFALDKFISFDTQIINVADEVQALRLELIQLLASEGDPEAAANSRSRPLKVHELLARNFVSLLTQDLHVLDWPLHRHQACILVRTAKLILTGDTPISGTFISGVLDADRIDFVRRDLTFSGLLRSSVDYSRLFSLYELAEKGPEEYAARPSLRASAEAEKLLWERFLDYKHVAAHHKVHLYDELLERLIYYSFLDGTLTGFLRQLCVLLKVDSASTRSVRKDTALAELKQNLLTGFDDSWLDAVLRGGYIKAVRRHGAFEFKTELFEALSEKRGFFTTLFKRDDDYNQFVEVHKLDKVSAQEKLVDDSIRFLSIKDRTVSIAARIRQSKYEWEKELSQSLNELVGSNGPKVIIGDAFRKISDGFGKDKGAAEFFGLTELRGFLETKLRNTMPFNAWFVDQGFVGHGDTTTRAWLEAQLAEKLIESVQETKAPIQG